MAAKTKKEPVKSKKKSADTVTVAKTDDGSIQMTLTVPWATAEAMMQGVAKELGKDYEVAGFRKGKAPVDKLLKQIPRETLVTETLQKLLPELFGKAIREHKITPGMYPKFEIVSAEDGEDWQVRAVTCEMPKIKLGDYKKSVGGALKTKGIWTPEKGSEKEEKEPTREEKEQEVMKVLLEKVKVKLPKVMVDQEVDSRLAALLNRIEKLGLTLESYLSSAGKTVEDLRKEYAEAAEATMKMEFILGKISFEEKLEPSKAEVDAFVQASAANPEMTKQFESEEQKQVVKSVLRKRKALEMLVALG